MIKQFQTPFGEFNLKRIPDKDKNLQAWNSADSYLLNRLFESVQNGGIDLEQASILIMNDNFGALTLPMARFGCDSLTDSYISHEAMVKNIQKNCPETLSGVNLLKSTDELNKHYDVVLFKDVKSQALLKQQMMNLNGHISTGTLMLGAAMARNLQKTTLQMLTRIVGKAEASLAWKKARLIHINPGPGKPDFARDISRYYLDNGNEIVYGLANVFSRTKLDIGTRFFLQHFPLELKPVPKTIIDLGCGNGVLALKAAQTYPEACISCVDESYMAVASAQLTLEANLNDTHNINYQAGNGLTDFAPDSTDLILCNPPFHQQYVVGDEIAWQMFRQAKAVLGKGGELWLVGNRHLGYHAKIKRIFGNQQLVAANKKFVILKAVRT